MKTFLSSLTLGFALLHTAAATLLVEAEQFIRKGGWVVDTQFIETMGSPYLMAHGLGEPVADAGTDLQIPEAGTYKVWVRTFDWSEALDREGGAGRFSVSIGGKRIGGELGKGAAAWHWEPVGSVDLAKGKTTLAPHDLSGFGGRVASPRPTATMAVRRVPS